MRNGIYSMHSDTWSALIKHHRRRLNLTAKKLAQRAGIDPSYISLMERSGHIPKRDKVLALAQALQVDADSLLLAAGYVPENPEEWRDSAASLSIPEEIPEFGRCLRKISELSKDKQLEAAQFLNSYLDVLTHDCGGSSAD